MKVNKLINKLNKLKEKNGNIEVIIDFDENGWYSTEEVEIRDYEECEDSDTLKFINIKSSNEI